VASPWDESAAGKREGPESISSFAVLAEVLERTNRQRALEQVRQNQGAPGIDGMSVEERPDYLRGHWPEMRAQRVAGSYCPQPVRRVEIPKDKGNGVRVLGVPTVLDRFIQQELSRKGNPTSTPGAMDFARTAQPTRRYGSGRRISEMLTAGGLISTWKLSSTESITTG
jgi:hypothetical protein